MSGLQGWIKQLILIVFLAGVAEMLLPQAGMRKYAHTALGLLVLLTILVPFLDLLHQDVDWEVALAEAPAMPAVSAETSPAAAPSWGAAVPPARTPPQTSASAPEIASGVRRLEEVNRRLTLAAYSDRVAQQMAAVAAGVAGVARAEARVTVEETPGSPRYGTITGVALTVIPGLPGENGDGGGVIPVRPVEIGGKFPGAGGARVEVGPLRVAIIDVLAREFGLAPSRIQVKVEGD